MDSMELLLDRVARGTGSTIGELRLMDGEAQTTRLCWMLEEAWHAVKRHGETCIPAGRYELKLVHDSPLAIRYYARFSWFRGLLSIENVPNFTAVRIHVGNDAVNRPGGTDDTDGCPLPGMERQSLPGDNWRVLRSAEATKLVHELAYGAFDDGRRVFLTVSEDRILL